MSGSTTATARWRTGSAASASSIARLSDPETLGCTKTERSTPRGISMWRYCAGKASGGV